MSNTSNHRTPTNQFSRDQTLLANTTRTEHRDDRGNLFFTSYDTIDLSQANGPTSRSPDQCIVALTGLGKGGIGHASAYEMAVNRKHVVFACDRETGRAVQAADEITKAGGEIHFIEADVSTEEGVQLFMGEIEQHAGRLDLLVCNAGWAGADTSLDNIRDLSLSHYRELIDANLTSAFLCTQAALKLFDRQQRGGITFLGTHNGQIGHANLGQLVYGMAKTALSSLVGHLVLHYGDWLRVLLLRVGPVRTNSSNWAKRIKSDPRWEEIEGSILNPTRRLTRPHEVAETLAWLSLDAPQHLTGTEINLDGGFSALGLNVGTQGRDSIVKLGRALDSRNHTLGRAA